MAAPSCRHTRITSSHTRNAGQQQTVFSLRSLVTRSVVHAVIPLKKKRGGEVPLAAPKIQPTG